jgi:MoxR-like ATPase
MEEHKVSVDGVTRPLPDPFFVIATQNPVGASGTQKLPDSQLDRFLVRLSLGYPDHQSATDILKGRSMEQIEQVQAVCTAEQFLQMQKQAEDIFCRDEILDYIVHLIEATRKNELLTLGISPRGSLALLKMSRAHAFMEERDFVTPEDIHAVFYSVFNHRIQLSTRAKAAGETEFDVAEKILATVPIPRLK